MLISDWSSDVCSSDLLISGDAMTSHEDGLNATANNTATSNGDGHASAGSDEIWGTIGGEYGGDYGNDTIAGDALTVAANTTALANNDALVHAYGGTASAGHDRIIAADAHPVIGVDPEALGERGVEQDGNQDAGAGASAGDRREHGG